MLAQEEPSSSAVVPLSPAARALHRVWGEGGSHTPGPRAQDAGRGVRGERPLLLAGSRGVRRVGWRERVQETRALSREHRAQVSRPRPPPPPRAPARLPEGLTLLWITSLRRVSLWEQKKDRPA